MKTMSIGTLTHLMCDIVERFGKMVTIAGATKMGKRIYRAGNKLEHLYDVKSVNKL